MHLGAQVTKMCEKNYKKELARKCMIALYFKR